MEFNEFCDLMNEYSKKIYVEFNEKQLEQFYKYMNLLIEWNEKINLTAIMKPKEIIIKHFIDSLTINKYIKKETTLLDIGTGAGFPGIPIKILRPDIKVTLVDSLNKRINFLNEVIYKIELKEIESIHSRAEEFGQNKKYREKFDNVTSRAVASLNILSEYMLPLVKLNGQCICMKGNNIKQEMEDSKKAIEILGGKITRIDEFELPKTDIKRNIIIVNKLKLTPDKYPRKAGTPVKEPLK